MSARLLAGLVALGAVATAAAERPLFDAHLHYNGAEGSGLTPLEATAVLRRNGVERALVTGSPPQAAVELHRHAPERVVPILGVYREAGDKQDWHQDPNLPTWLAAQLEGGPWRGVGELHIFAPHRHSPVFLRVVELATDRGLPLQLHADPAVIDTVFDHAPGATVLWAHAGAYPCPALLRDYLQRYPRLYLDLSMRDGRIAPGGELDPQWELLLMEHPGRFMVGVDTYSADRWERFPEVVARQRRWLARLPEEVARELATGTAERLFPRP